MSDENVINFHRIVREARGVAALRKLDPIQIEHEDLEEEDRINLQMFLNSTYQFMSALGATKDMPTVCHAVVLAVAVRVAKECPAEIKDRFIEELCKCLRSGAENTRIEKESK